MLRIERAIQTLKSWKESPVLDIAEATIAPGDFRSPSEALASGEGKTVKLPWFVSSRDERFFVSFEADVPRVQDGYDLFLELSTGREGEWDAVNPQLLAYVNGKIICGLDVNHRQVPMRPEWHGSKAEIGLHLYTGMSAGDIRLRIRFVKRATWIHDAYYDLKVAKDAYEALPKDGEDAAFIRRALTEAVYGLRLESAESADTRRSILEMSAALGSRLYGKTGLMSRYTVHAVGHTHIDVAWLWDLRQTAEKVARSFSTALELQDRYPDYKFMASQPVLYEMLEAGQSSVYERVARACEDGMWEPEGAMYLEADCNLIGGESMIRQIELGQRYFTERFGRPSRTLWLPDVFGYSAAMPQIMRGFGIELFVTSKISWNDVNKLPYDSFRWRGIDGSELPTQFITTTSMQIIGKGEFKTIYEGNFTPSETLGSIMRHQQRESQPNAVMPFGFGDGGGGANEEMLENAKRLVKGLPGMPTVRMSHVSDFLRAFQAVPESTLPVWAGELYLEYHRGTYTTNAGIKQRHRRLENALLLAERLHAQIGVDDGGFAEKLEKDWKILLLNQFHDILPGTSVKRVYDEAYVQLDASLESTRRATSELLSKYNTNNNDEIVFYNHHGHPFAGIVSLPAGIPSDTKSLFIGNRIFPVQSLPGGESIVALNGLPALSLTGASLDSSARDESEQAGKSTGFILSESSYSVDTSFYKAELDSAGEMVSLYDKSADRELILAGGRGNRLRAYEDRPLRWDAWDINDDYRRFPIDFAGKPEISLIQDGPVALVIGIARDIGKSRIEQELYFYKTSRRIDFKTHIDWHERQVLLRTEFDLAVNATDARFDIQFGNVRRPVDENHGYHSAMFEVCAAHWGDLSEDDYGVALMSDDKFGYSARGPSLGLSLLKSPTWPNEESDQGEHRFSYALLPHQGDSARGGVHLEALRFTQPPLCVRGATPHAGPAPSWLSGLPENLMVESLRVLKDGTVEIRLVEHCNRRGTASLSFSRSYKKIERISLRGDPVSLHEPDGGVYTITYKPFEIITFRLHDGDKR